VTLNFIAKAMQSENKIEEGGTRYELILALGLGWRVFLLG
jgi:hypothetical protein